jgi:hypothetical protein
MDMKRVLVVVLVVTVLFTGVPLLMAMSTTSCAECELAMMTASSCLLAVLAAVVAIAPALSRVPLLALVAVLSSLLASSGLDRPPRLA